MSPSQRRTRASGFTFTEVLIAMAVLLFVFMSALAALSLGFKMLEEARTSTLSSQILQSELENLRLKNWTQLEALDPSTDFPVEVDPAIKGFPKFSCKRVLEDTSGYEGLLMTATLTVEWTTNDGRNRSRRYITYIAKDGINDYYYRAL